MKTIVVSATSDLVTDRRIAKTCHELHDRGYKVLLVGRNLKSSLPLSKTPYQQLRFSLPFETGVLFYLSFHLRLFFFLLSHKFDLYWSNDLDTLLPNYLISKVRRKPLVYDSHELFTEVPALVNKRIKKGIWTAIEKRVVPKVDVFITVNQSIADVFYHKYLKKAHVIRNVPSLEALPTPQTRAALNIPEDHIILVLQGTGINEGRGLEEIIDSFEYLKLTTLLIIGKGDVLNRLKVRIKEKGLSNCIFILGHMPYLDMMAYTQMADIGLAFDKASCLNYELALPNKIFDYMHAGIAVVCGPQIEISNLVLKHQCGETMSQVTPHSIAQAILKIQSNPSLLNRYKDNSKKARDTENWNLERQQFDGILSEITTS